VAGVVFGGLDRMGIPVGVTLPGVLGVTGVFTVAGASISTWITIAKRTIQACSAILTVAFAADHSTAGVLVIAVLTPVLTRRTGMSKELHS